MAFNLRFGILSLLIALALAANATVPVRAAAPTEEAVSVTVPGGMLSGTLTLPNGKGPFPVALIIAGSGPTDRNGNQHGGIQTDDYKLLAGVLAESGIATLRYDKRTIGQSVFANLPERDLRFEMFVDDAVALLQHLQADKRFSKVEIIGHSEGSLIGMLAAQRDPDVRAFVSLAGAGSGAADVLTAQLRAGGVPPAVLGQVAVVLKALRAGQTVPQVPQSDPLFRPSVQPYLISWFRYDPALEIAKLHIPVLIVQGTTDIQVGVNDAQKLSAALPAAKLVLIGGMNHVLRDAPAERTANIATYSQPALPLDAQLVKELRAFLR